MSSPLSALPVDPFHSPELYLTSLFDPHSTTTLLTFPPSPSDTVSSISTEPPQTPISRPHSAPLHVVCTAPLVAPIPLPYHSPTFLQFDLPDIDEDLSQPAYIASAVRRTHNNNNNNGTIIHTTNNKRKREHDQSDPDLTADSDIIMAPPPAKRPFVPVQQWQHQHQHQHHPQQHYQDPYPHRQGPRHRQHSRSNPSTPSDSSSSSAVTGSRRRPYPQQHVDQREPLSYSASYLNLRRHAMQQMQQQPQPQLQQYCQPGLPPHGQQFYLSQFQFQYPFQPQFQHHRHHHHHSPHHQIQQRSF